MGTMETDLKSVDDKKSMETKYIDKETRPMKLQRYC